MDWNDAAHTDLLRAILQTTPVTPAVVRDISINMEAMGYSCSQRAISYML